MDNAPEERRKDVCYFNCAGRAFPGFTLIELLVVIAITLILASLLLVAAARAMGASRKASCQSNLRQMGLVIGMYSDENGAQLPRDLKTIYPHYLNDLNILVCPASDDSVGKYPEEVERWSSYHYRISGENAVMTDKEKPHAGRRNRLAYSEELGLSIESITGPG